ncbi:MAG: acyl-CoA thioesterase [Bdellovibrionota bacterium]
MILRTLWVFFWRGGLEKVNAFQKTEITMRVLPVDLDLLMHVNNGVYFSFMDFGRWDMIFRNGSYDLAKQNGWYSVVAGETIRFKRSLKLWDKFTLKTQIIGHDDKYFFIEQTFHLKDQEMARGLVKVRFLKKSGGTVDVSDVLTGLNLAEKKVPELSQDWASLEKKYLF